MSQVTRGLPEHEQEDIPSVETSPEGNHRSTALDRLFVKMLLRRIGSPEVQIVLWDGTVYGDAASSMRRIVFREPHGLHRLLFDAVTGFGEAYSENEIAVEGDLIDVIAAIDRAMSKTRNGHRSSRQMRWPTFRHSISASKSSVHHHYDIGNEFYRLWLDPQFVYSCAYYTNQQATLDEAQVAKLDYVCRKLRLKPGETVVEAGSGWGALTLHMAREYGVTVRAFNLSGEQVDFARDRAQAEGLSDRVEFMEDDYRNITGKYDAFVSVGMLEHIGAENYGGLGQLVGRVLKTGGRGLIHSIGRNVARPLDRWTLKYIFPGAYAPSLREMMDLFGDQGFSVLDVENLRLHYMRTCADWLARFEQHADQVQRMFDERFVRMWRLYLAASSAAFRNGDLQLFQILFARADNNDLPWTRGDWYTP